MGITAVRLLVVEDTAKMATLLQRAFREDGYAVDVQASGNEAVWMASECDFDAVILDVGLPDIDGFDVCRQLRDRARWMPILMLTAREGVPDRVRGLDVGADDYLTKPFSIEELRARVRALVRRNPGERPAVLTVGDLRLDPAARTVCRGTTAISLAAKEFAILECLASDPGRVVSRQEVLERAWDEHWYGPTKVLDVHMAALRRKLARPGLIETVYGHGFRLADPPNG